MYNKIMTGYQYQKFRKYLVLGIFPFFALGVATSCSWVEYLEIPSASPEKKLSKSQELREMVRRGNIEKTMTLIEQGVDYKSMDKAGSTAYHYAQLSGNQDLISYLLSKGADAELPFPTEPKLIDRLFSTVNVSPGAAVLVAQNGKIVFQKGYGYADLTSQKPITPKTKFPIASVTKSFTATAILKLQEQGRLRVDDPLSKFIPDYPRANEVTLHHLLTHTSGISHDEFYKGHSKVRAKHRTPEEMIESFKQYPLDFNPGEKWKYSNSGYFLLSDIISKVSGQPYSEYLKNQFFTPLAMKNSGVLDRTFRQKDGAIGYRDQNGQFSEAFLLSPSQAYGAGAIYSTVRDLYRWNEGIFNNKVLNSDSLNTAFTPVILKNASPPSNNLLALLGGNYGYGWFISKHRGLRLISHAGGLPGYVTQLVRYPDQKLTIVILANSRPGKLTPIWLTKRIAEFYLWEQMETYKLPKVSTTFDPKVYQTYVGKYDFLGKTVTISIKSGHLVGQISDQPRIKLYPINDHQFFTRTENTKFEFTKNKGNPVKEIYLIYDDLKVPAYRIPESS